jgi:hypothetical protein
VRVISNGRLKRAVDDGDLAGANASTTQLNGQDDPFTIVEWQTMALGWRDFQADLRYAAQNGVRVWRMKVAVIASAA